MKLCGDLNGKEIPKKRGCMYTASQVAQTVKNLPAMQETWVQSRGGEYPLDDSMTTLSSILAWRISMDRGAWWAAVHGVAKSQT